MVTLSSEDGRASFTINFDVPQDAQRLVLADEPGNEYHFGSGAWVRSGTFHHIATYEVDAGRTSYAFWSDVVDAADEGLSIREHPELGPRVSDLARAGLISLLQLCNLRNGFGAPPEKGWAVDTLRALWEEARDNYDVAEIYVFAATHGSSIKHARALETLAESVRHGKGFRDYAGRAIPRTPDRYKRMIDQWELEKNNDRDPWGRI